MIFSVQILGRLRAVVARHGLAALVLGAAALAGCGQKGPLFLPVPPKAPPASLISTNPPGATPAAAATPAAPASASR
jgi:predicted small lipoprotein YifL